MTARILDGKAISMQIRSELAERVATFKAGGQPVPCLAAVLVGGDPASQIYVRNKQRACERVGIESRLFQLAESTSQQDLLDLVGTLNEDPAIHGILVQLPLPRTIAATCILDAIDPLKDVDAFSPENVGLLSQGRPRFLPCTPHGVLQILHRSGIPAAGRHVVVVGRSDIVGRPLAQLLTQRDSHLGPEAVNATVTVCHSRTQDLSAVTRQAEILVSAIGRARFITGPMVQPGATVIDVGINRTDEGLVGDVDASSVAGIAGHLTPVPGGVGPLTVAMLLRNTLTAAELQAG